MEIKINPKKKKIVISYDIKEESKKILSQAQSLAESLPDYLVKIVQTFSKSKKDKGSRILISSPVFIITIPLTLVLCRFVF